MQKFNQGELETQITEVVQPDTHVATDGNAVMHRIHCNFAQNIELWNAKKTTYLRYHILLQ